MFSYRSAKWALDFLHSASRQLSRSPYRWSRAIISIHTGPEPQTSLRSLARPSSASCHVFQEHSAAQEIQDGRPMVIALSYLPRLPPALFVPPTAPPHPLSHRPISPHHHSISQNCLDLIRVPFKKRGKALATVGSIAVVCSGCIFPAAPLHSALWLRGRGPHY